MNNKHQTPLEGALATHRRERFQAALRGALEQKKLSYRHSPGAYETLDSEDAFRQSVDLGFQIGRANRAHEVNDPIFTPLFVSILGAGGFGLTGAVLSTAVMIASAIATTSVVAGVQTR
jgi:hypothetical protein